MNTNRTSSFPADKNKTDFRDKVLIGFCVSIVLMATGAHWVYTERSALIGVLLMAVTTSQCVCAALYYRATKPNKNESAGP
jgi:hypothetical protein